MWKADIRVRQRAQRALDPGSKKTGSEAVSFAPRFFALRAQADKDIRAPVLPWALTPLLFAMGP